MGVVWGTSYTLLSVLTKKELSMNLLLSRRMLYEWAVAVISGILIYSLINALFRSA
jgi:hypothetical protein